MKPKRRASKQVDAIIYGDQSVLEKGKFWEPSHRKTRPRQEARTDAGQVRKFTWALGYENCPGARTSSPGGPCPCDRICPVCGATSGKIGIGCQECKSCYLPGYEDVEQNE